MADLYRSTIAEIFSSSIFAKTYYFDPLKLIYLAFEMADDMQGSPYILFINNLVSFSAKLIY